MPLLRAGVAMELRAAEGTFLYDCHGRRFATIDHGATATSGFAPLFLAQLFGVAVRDWPELLPATQATLQDMPPGEADAWLRTNRSVKKSLFAAAEAALLAYPEMERFVERRTGALAPFVLRDEFLHQANVSLTELRVRAGEHVTKSVINDALQEPSQREGLRHCLSALARGIAPDDQGWFTRLELAHAVVDASSKPRRRAPSGLYSLGHSTLLIRSDHAGLLIDPIPLSGLVADPAAVPLDVLRAQSDAVALTHGHFDHYHLPSLLALSDLPQFVPSVPRSSIVCEDIAARLHEWGCVRARAVKWGSIFEVGDIRVHVLPFYGEQFLTSECWPDARNWGSCYVVETPRARVLVAADAGFEPGESVIDMVARWVDANGAIDIVAAQSIGLQTSFGGGDPDLQITALTCAHRATQAFELLRPEHRATLAPQDLPVLCRAAQARALIPYGQFEFRIGEATVRPSVHAAVVKTMSDAGSDTAVVETRIGRGVAFEPFGAETSQV